MAKYQGLFAALIVGVLMTACGTVKEKTAPCKRPANLTSFTEAAEKDCGPLRPVNDPVAAFAALGVADQ
ncbi:hypothetical protein QA648_22375 (plasmid) [Rhizobium sp. CB3171]|uniref:hypothetical protein n=1 Tax=unclassified Rhizobium TaxID=2613769 RepID=UPI000CDF2E4D|nr:MULTISPECIES: hypothetical protein [unclassified Rhizobium]AVA25788.1 hypothetical protein NXC24_PC01354 [Rhizobium sp. NXC24]WFU05904.1 hypothetical protein QA648_22375 [Rhizobium sp. CB3171]